MNGHNDNKFFQTMSPISSLSSLSSLSSCTSSSSFKFHNSITPNMIIHNINHNISPLSSSPQIEKLLDNYIQLQKNKNTNKNNNISILQNDKQFEPQSPVIEKNTTTSTTTIEPVPPQSLLSSINEMNNKKILKRGVGEGGRGGGGGGGGLDQEGYIGRPIKRLNTNVTAITTTTTTTTTNDNNTSTTIVVNNQLDIKFKQQLSPDLNPFASHNIHDGTVEEKRLQLGNMEEELITRTCIDQNHLDWWNQSPSNLPITEFYQEADGRNYKRRCKRCFNRYSVYRKKVRDASKNNNIIQKSSSSPFSKPVDNVDKLKNMYIFTPRQQKL